MEIQPLVGEVKMFFQANGLGEMWKEEPHQRPGHGPHHQPPTSPTQPTPPTPSSGI